MTGRVFAPVGLRAARHSAGTVSRTINDGNAIRRPVTSSHHSSSPRSSLHLGNKRDRSPHVSGPFLPADSSTRPAARVSDCAASCADALVKSVHFEHAAG